MNEMPGKISQDRSGEAKKNRRLLGGPRLVRNKLQGKVFLVPSFVTVVGIFCGFLAIISALKGNFAYAAKCIGVAMILDGLDGRVARKLNATSAFGKEFDSLSDLIAFGVAPAVLVYCWAFAQTADEIGIMVTFVYVVCAATRLARFNVSEGSSPSAHFVGLPSPMAAAAIASVPYLYPEVLSEQIPVSIILIYTLFIAGLMVSTLPFFSIKKIKLTQENVRYMLILLSAVVGLTWYLSKFVVLLGAVGYALSGPVAYLSKRYFSKQTAKAENTG